VSASWWDWEPADYERDAVALERLESIEEERAVEEQARDRIEAHE
jgi:hypothetical protein